MTSSVVTTRQWNSARVRHSPPPQSPPDELLSPRAKSCHPSLSQIPQQQHDDDDDEIIEEIENVLDSIGISSSDDEDPPSHATFYR